MIEAGFESDVSAWSVFLPRCRGRLWRGKTGITFVEEVVLKTFENPTFCVLKAWARFDSPLYPRCSNRTETTSGGLFWHVIHPKERKSFVV